MNLVRKVFATLLLLAAAFISSAQDGSDIRYLDAKKIDSSLVGQYVHFDFFRRSSLGHQLDTVSIIIDQVPVRFAEVRNDDGYNNWFSQQGLRSIDSPEGLQVKISRLRLESLTTEALKVTMYLDYYKRNSQTACKSRELQYWFNKKDIAVVLIKTRQL